QIVLLPVAMGVLINSYWGPQLQRFQPYFPRLAVIMIVLVIAIVTALNAHNMSQLTPQLVITVILHNVLGLAGGYFLARRWYDEQTARTLAIEVGMQNSGLGAALAVKYFGAVAALPGALFSIGHNLSGALLAYYWQKRLDAHRNS
ncbi:MAG: bile acid:sodium symporter, partial [Pseudomonadota bacterium]|nr:bile acid:sodium symporter [Pseudomonadota bacterium]